MPKILDALPITTAITAQASAPLGLGTGSPGTTLIQIDFVYGSGGTTMNCWVQTSLEGSTWIDVANMSATTASKSRLMNLTRTPITTPYAPLDGALTADTVKDGLIGALWRTKVTTTGTYGGSTTLTVTVIPGEG